MERMENGGRKPPNLHQKLQTAKNMEKSCKEDLEKIVSSMCMQISSDIEEGKHKESVIQLPSAGEEIEYFKIYEVHYEGEDVSPKFLTFSVQVPLLRKTVRKNREEINTEIAFDTANFMESYTKYNGKYAMPPMLKIVDDTHSMLKGVRYTREETHQFDYSKELGKEEHSAEGFQKFAKSLYPTFCRDYDATYENNQRPDKSFKEIKKLMKPQTYVSSDNNEGLNLRVYTCKLGPYYETPPHIHHHDEDTVSMGNEICGLTSRGMHIYMEWNGKKYNMYIKQIIGVKGMGVQSFCCIEKSENKEEGKTQKFSVGEAKIPKYVIGRQAKDVHWHLLASTCMEKQVNHLGGEKEWSLNHTGIKMHVVRPSDNVVYAKLECKWNSGQAQKTLETYFTLCTFRIFHVRPPMEANWREGKRDLQPIPKDLNKPMYKMLSKMQNSSTMKLTATQKPSALKELVEAQGVPAVKTLTQQKDPVETLTKKKDPVETLAQKNDPVETLTKKKESVKTLTQKKDPVETLTEKNDPVETLTKKNEPEKILEEKILTQQKDPEKISTQKKAPEKISLDKKKDPEKTSPPKKEKKKKGLDPETAAVLKESSRAGIGYDKSLEIVNMHLSKLMGSRLNLKSISKQSAIASKCAESLNLFS